MSTHKSIDLICVVVLLLTLLLTVLFINGERLGVRVLVDEDAEGAALSGYFTANDLQGDWDASSVTRITLQGDTAAISGGGAYFHDGSVVISSAGRFVLSGELDGSVVVDAESRSKVWLLLDGVELHCEDDACLRVNQADKVFLTLAAGTKNRMTGGAAYSEAALADGTDGVIFSHDDLTVNGSGSLTVTAACLHGVAVNDSLVVAGGELTVTAPEDALHANDSLRICRASLTLEAGDDGLYLKNPGSLLYVESGSLDVDAGGDGFHSGADVLLAGGDVTVRAYDDAVHADAGIAVTGGVFTAESCYEGFEALTIDVSGGEVSIRCTDDGLNANGNSGGFGPFRENTGEAAVETWIHIRGGSLTVVNETARDADGLDSNGDLIVSGGTVRVSLPGAGSNSALDCGSESGGVCLVTGGEVVACGSSAMAEGFGGDSTQGSILYTCAAETEAGTTVTLQTAEGAELLRYTAPCGFTSVLLSSPAMQLGETYRLTLGETEEDVVLSEIAVRAGSESAGFGGPKPDRDGERPEMPALSGERPDGAQMGPPSGMPDFPGERPDGAQTEEASAAAAAVFTPGPETWILLALSFLALAGGLVLAVRFEP